MLPFNSLKAILFDLDGTLRHDRPNGFDTFVDYAEELGCVFTLAQLQHGERWVHSYWAASSDLDTDLREAGDQTPDFWLRYSQRLLRTLEAPGDLAALAVSINQIFDERYEPDVHVPDDALPMLQKLRAAGYTLGLVSNRSRPLADVAAELGLDGAFHFTLSAGQAQSWKPDPGIFLQAVALAGCQPAEAVYVGDNLYADVEGSRGAGLHPVLLDPKGLFHNPGCPVIHTLGELEMALEQLGTKFFLQASVS